MGTKLTQREKSIKKQKREETRGKTRRRVSKRQTNQKNDKFTQTRLFANFGTTNITRSMRTTPHGSKWVEKDVARLIRAEGEKNCKNAVLRHQAHRGPETDKKT
jgi:hypothetical protein